MQVDERETALERQTEARDDNLMERFERHGLSRFRARDAVLAVLVTALLLVLLDGKSVRKAGDQMNPGIGRDVVLAVGRPAAAVAGALPLASAAHNATAWLAPDQNLTSGPGSFAASASSSGANQIPPVTPDAFAAPTIGAKPPARRPLRTLLVTGDSMSTPLDADLASALVGRRVRVIRDPHLGSGISKTDIVDWGRLATTQVQRDHPDAIVVFIGANEGFPMGGPGGRPVECCGADWAAIYAQRARQMVNTYRQGGAAVVYWLTLPTPRDPDREQIAKVVNAAITVAAQPWAAQVRVIDTVPIFTPGYRYRDAMPIGGSEKIVREADGIHLNDVGSSLLAKTLLGDIATDFTY